MKNITAHLYQDQLHIYKGQKLLSVLPTDIQNNDGAPAVEIKIIQNNERRQILIKYLFSTQEDNKIIAKKCKELAGAVSKVSFVTYRNPTLNIEAGDLKIFNEKAEN
jgi:hypothetical protein